MPKKNTNKNPNDPRSARTIGYIKQEMMVLIAYEPYEKIRVEQILSDTKISSNAFYRYFASKQDVLDAIREDMLVELRTELETAQSSSLSEGVEIFYQYCDSDNQAKRKLLNSEEYSVFAETLCDEYFSSDFFRAFCPDQDAFETASGFISDVSFGIYSRWQKHPPDDRKDPGILADMTANLLLDGLQGNEEK